MSSVVSELGSLADSLHVVVWEASPPGGRLTFVGQSISALLGLSPSEWADPDVRLRYVHPDDRARVSEHWQRLGEPGETGCIEFRGIGADGRVVWLREKATAERSESGEARAFRGLLLEVPREPVAGEALASRSAALEPFARQVGRIAHDYNNALTALCGYTEVLEASLQDAASLRTAADLRAASERVAELTSQLRALVADALPGSSPALGASSGAGATRATAPDGKVVLLAEDEAIVRRTMVETLRREGWRVIEAGSGAEALRLAEAAATPMDLLVTDIVMPGMDGRELAERLRRVWPTLPVLFVTGFSSEADPRRLPGPGTALLQKPFLPETLLSRARSLLGVPSR